MGAPRGGRRPGRRRRCVAMFGVVLGRVVPADRPRHVRRRRRLDGAGDPAGAAVIVEPVAPRDLAVGDIVSLRSGPSAPSSPTGSSASPSATAQVWIETKGDANATADPSMTPASAVIGRVVVDDPVRRLPRRLLSIPSGVLFVIALGSSCCCWPRGCSSVGATPRRAAHAGRSRDPRSARGPDRRATGSRDHADPRRGVCACRRCSSSFDPAARRRPGADDAGALHRCGRVDRLARERTRSSRPRRLAATGGATITLTWTRRPTPTPPATTLPRDELRRDVHARRDDHAAHRDRPHRQPRQPARSGIACAPTSRAGRASTATRSARTSGTDAYVRLRQQRRRHHRRRRQQRLPDEPGERLRRRLVFATDTNSGTGGTASCGTGAAPDTTKDRHRFWGFALGLPGTRHLDQRHPGPGRPGAQQHRPARPTCAPSSRGTAGRPGRRSRPRRSRRRRDDLHLRRRPSTRGAGPGRSPS